MPITTYNPSTGEKLKEYEEFSVQKCNSLIDKSYEAFSKWKYTDFNRRSKLMQKASAILNDRKEKYAKLMALEMGKPFKQGISEIEKCAWVCDYYSGKAEIFLHDESVNTEMGKSYITFQPLGPVLAIMPWNFPFWQVFRFAAPALMAGNAGLLKHSSNTMGCAIEIENVFKDAGFPEGLFTTLVVSSNPVLDLMENKNIKAVTLTGSTPVGSKVAEKAGKLLKKTVLELGGSDPYIVLEDADLDSAADLCVTARLINSGQSCIAAKRFIIVESVYEEFAEKFTQIMKEKKMGEPMLDVDLGPQARQDLQLDLQRQVEETVKKGAELLVGGNITEGNGYFYPPTVLGNVSEDMTAFYEETFGPVAALIKAKDDKDAVRLANKTIFGLGGAVFGKNIERAEKLARNEIETGTCVVNDFVRSDPRLPFGGNKAVRLWQGAFFVRYS